MNSSTDLVATELPLKSVLESLKKIRILWISLSILHTNTCTFTYFSDRHTNHSQKTAKIILSSSTIPCFQIYSMDWIDQSSINQSVNPSVSKSVSQLSTEDLCFEHISATVQMAGKIEEEVSKVYSLCIMDFVIYNQLNEIYNLQISTRYCTVIRPRNKPHNNINAKLYYS